MGLLSAISEADSDNILTIETSVLHRHFKSNIQHFPVRSWYKLSNLPANVGPKVVVLYPDSATIHMYIYRPIPPIV